MQKKTRVLIGAVMLFMMMLCMEVFAGGLTISKDSMTIEKGKSKTLTVSYNGTKVSGVTWGSSDSSVATVSSSGKVTGKLAGSAVITAMYQGQSAECLVSVVKTTETKTIRYNVLILDNSKSMKGSPMSKAKKAATRFAKTVMSADGTNYCAVVSLNTGSEIICDFTTSKSKVKKAIQKFSAKGATNMYAAFKNAEKLLKNVPDGSNIIKNVILCSDGLYGEVGEDRMSNILRMAVAKETKMNDLCADFVDEAILAGGRDNITVICIRI